MGYVAMLWLSKISQQVKKNISDKYLYKKETNKKLLILTELFWGSSREYTRLCCNLKFNRGGLSP